MAYQSKKSFPNFLAISKLSASKKRDFLLGLANLRDGDVELFVRKFWGFFFASMETFKEATVSMQIPPWNLINVEREQLRNAWEQRDRRAREWLIWELRLGFWYQVSQGVGRHLLRLPVVNDASYPPPYWFEQTMIYLAEHATMAKVCENTTCQVQKFYFAATAKQRFCSDACAAPTIRASKLRWWNDNRKGKTQ